MVDAVRGNHNQYCRTNGHPLLTSAIADIYTKGAMVVCCSYERVDGGIFAALCLSRRVKGCYGPRQGAEYRDLMMLPIPAELGRPVDGMKEVCVTVGATQVIRACGFRRL